MARRANERNDLPELRALFDLCREKGVVRYHETADSREIVFGPMISAEEAKKLKAEGKDPNGPRRAHYEQLLNRPVADKELEMLP